MQNKITFNKHNVTNGTKKARVFYSINGRTDGRNCVTIYAKDLTANLKAIFADAVNSTEVNTDYFETSKINFLKHHLFTLLRLNAHSLTNN